MYEAVTATFDCCGHSFTAKGKRILSEGWREIDRIFRASLKERPADGDGGTLPDFTEGQVFDGAEVSVTEHFTQPPKPYTEDILSQEKKEVDKVIINSAELEKYFGKDKSPREMKDKIISLLDDWKAKQPPELGKPEKKTDLEK